MTSLRVSEQEARIALGRVPHERFQKAIARNWRVDGGNVDARSVCWLFCWAKNGMSSVTTAEAAQQVFDELLPVSFDRFDAAVDHEWARKARYASDWDAQSVESELRTLLMPAPTRAPGAATQPTATVEEVFGDRAAFARRIIATGAMDECGRMTQYVNLSFQEKTNIAQIHPHENGIGLVLRSRGRVLPATLFEEIPVASLAGYRGANKSWLDGAGRTFEGKGPAIAYLIPDEVDGLGGDSKEWQEVARLLDHAKTLV